MESNLEPGETRALTPSKLTLPLRSKASPERGAMIQGRTIPHIVRDDMTRRDFAFHRYWLDRLCPTSSHNP